MKNIQMVSEKKVGKKWIPDDYKITDEKEVYKDLAKCMVAKSLKKCKWITSIRRVTNYDGTSTVTVTMDNGFRRIYTVED